MDISRFQEECFQTAADHGWWPTKEVDVSGAESDTAVMVKRLDLHQVNIPEKLALMHSEISEALEHFRAGNMEMFLDEGKPDGFWIELGDCIIRILDLAGAYNVDMEYMLRLKADYNKTRPYRHGDKKC